MIGSVKTLGCLLFLFQFSLCMDYKNSSKEKIARAKSRSSLFGRKTRQENIEDTNPKAYGRSASTPNYKNPIGDNAQERLDALNDAIKGNKNPSKIKKVLKSGGMSKSCDILPTNTNPLMLAMENLDKLYREKSKISDDGLKVLVLLLREREKRKKTISQPVTLVEQIDRLREQYEKPTNDMPKKCEQGFFDALKGKILVEQIAVNKNLFKAIENNNIDDFQKALNGGADRNVQRDKDGKTPLIELIEYMSTHQGSETKINKAVEMFNALLAPGSNIDIHLTDNQGKNALSIAQYYNLSKIEEDMIAKIGGEMNPTSNAIRKFPETRFVAAGDGKDVSK